MSEPTDNPESPSDSIRDDVNNIGNNSNDHARVQETDDTCQPRNDQITNHPDTSEGHPGGTFISREGLQYLGSVSEGFKDLSTFAQKVDLMARNFQQFLNTLNKTQGPPESSHSLHGLQEQLLAV